MTTSIVQYIKGWAHKITDGAVHVIIGTGTGVTPDTTLDAVTSTGESTPLLLAAKDFTEQLLITGTALVTIYVSLDGSDYYPLVEDVSAANSMYNISGPFYDIKFDVTSISSGSVTAKVRQ